MYCKFTRVPPYIFLKIQEKALPTLKRLLTGSRPEEVGHDENGDSIEHEPQTHFSLQRCEAVRVQPMGSTHCVCRRLLCQIAVGGLVKYHIRAWAMTVRCQTHMVASVGPRFSTMFIKDVVTLFQVMMPLTSSPNSHKRAK